MPRIEEGWEDHTRRSLKVLCADVAFRHSEDLTHVKQILSGGIAGCVAKTAVAPLSRVTILMQVQSMRPHKFADGASPNNRYLYSSLQKILQEEGLAGFWRGNGAMALHRFPYTAITFQGHSFLKEKLEQFPAIPEQLHSFVGAGCSACTACIVCYPMDVVKTRLTTQTKTRYYEGILDCLVKIHKDEGMRGWYRGLGMSICSVVPMIALNFTLYEHFYWLYTGLGMPTYVHSFLAGGTSGALASMTIFPVDLLRRQLQMVGVGGRKPVYNGVLDAAWQVFDTGARLYPTRSPLRIFWGFREFFRGLMPDLIKATPHNAIMFCVHNQLMHTKWYLEH